MMAGLLRRRRSSATDRRRGRWRRRLLWTAAIVLVLALLCAAGLWISLPDVRPLAKTNPETTAFIELRRQQAARAGKRFRLRWRWRRSSRISPYLRHAVVRAEDIKFWKHEGVDWDALEKAAQRNLDEGSLSIGASTITQQLAKNLYLSPSRNPIRKLRELFIARRLERHLGKRRILEIYLNVAEWGPNVFGAEAAARYWYRRPASRLTPLQAARLVVALPNPHRRSPRVRSYWLRRKAARLVWAMWRSRLIDEQARDDAFDELGVLRRRRR